MPHLPQNGVLKLIVELMVLVGTILGGFAWISSSLHTIDLRLAAMEYSMGDRWTGQDMQIWTLRFRGQNPRLDVPDPIYVIQDRLSNKR